MVTGTISASRLSRSVETLRGRPLGTEVERRADDGDGSHRRVERPAEQSEAVVAGDDVALVEDDDSGGAGGGGVVCLHREVARTPLDEGDVPGGESGEVGCFAAARRRPVAVEVHVDGGDWRGDVPLTGEVHREVVDTEGVGGGGGADLLEDGALEVGPLVGELLAPRVVAGRVEQPLDVVDGLGRGRPCPAARLPPLASAISWNFSRWSVMPATVTASRRALVSVTTAAWAVVPARANVPHSAAVAATAPTRILVSLRFTESLPLLRNRASVRVGRRTPSDAR